MPEVGGRVFWLGCFDPFQGFQRGEDESGGEEQKKMKDEGEGTLVWVFSIMCCVSGWVHHFTKSRVKT